MTDSVCSIYDSAAQRQSLFSTLSDAEQAMVSGGFINFSPVASDLQQEGTNPFTIDEKVGTTRQGQDVTMGDLLQNFARQGLVPSRAFGDLLG